MKLVRSKDLVPKHRDEGSGVQAMSWLRRRDECCRRERKPLGVAAAGALLALLVPKCPLCLATYLSFLGAATSLVGWLRPLGVALTFAGLAVAAWRYLGRGSSPSRSPTQSSSST